MYESGNGAPRDLGRANDLYRRACDGGAMTGCADLGRLYYFPASASRRTRCAASISRTRRAAAATRAPVPASVAAYLSGNGAGKDVGRAIAGPVIGVRHSGGAEACFNVGDVFRTGQAGMVDMPRAVGF